jgi:hypothetical protein
MERIFREPLFHLVSLWTRIYLALGWMSLTSRSLGKPPAIKVWVNLKVNHAYQFKRRYRGAPRSPYDR